MSKKLRDVMESTINKAGKTLSGVKTQIKHITSKLASEPQYHITRGRLGSTYVVATCSNCGKDIGKAPVSDQAFKPGNIETKEKALAFLIRCETCGRYVGRKCCWGGAGKCTVCSVIDEDQPE